MGAHHALAALLLAVLAPHGAAATIWAKPPMQQQQQQQQQQRQQQQQQRQQQRTLQATSSETTAPSTYFWYNNVTLKSQYARPEEDLGLFDENFKQSYWVVEVDGKKVATWEKPSALDWHTIYDATHGLPYFRNNALDTTTWDRPACLGWSKRALDKVFYYNTVTKEAAWPGEVPEYVPYQSESGHHYWHDKRTQQSTYEPTSEEAAWYEAESQLHEHEGKFRTYYYNAMNKLSTWELPARSNLAWKKSYVEVEL
jgi:hypothetical protein